MAVALSTALRNARLDEVTAAIDGGSGAGLLRIYDGTRPATGAAITTQTLLAEVSLSDPCAPAAAAGVLTFTTPASDPSANNSGTAAWARVVTSAGTFVADLNVGTSGSDLNLSTLTFVAGDTFSITSWTMTEGNP